MEIATFYHLISAILSVKPDRSQFFRYEDLTLNCAVPGNFSGWTVKKKSSAEFSQQCGTDWGRINGSVCKVRRLKIVDTGVYWCESERGERSNVLHIKVTDGLVLEIPALPVKEGDKVTLRCLQKDNSVLSSKFSASFFKDGVFIGTEPGGKMILPSVSKSDEGSYKCQHPSGLESPLSLLTVTVRDSGPTSETPLSSSTSLPKIVCYLLLFIMYTLIIIVCIYGYLKWSQARSENKRRASGHLISE